MRKRKIIIRIRAYIGSFLLLKINGGTLMNKKMRELRQQIVNKKAEARQLADENKITEAKAMLEEIKSLEERYDIEAALFEEEKQIDDEVKNKDNKKEKDSVKEFANAARNGFKVNNKMNEGTPLDGGYTVPEDILTRINTYRESKKSLKDLVTVEKVTTNKGQRTFKKRYN